MKETYSERLHQAFEGMAAQRESNLTHTQNDLKFRRDLLDRFVILRRDVVRNSMTALSNFLHDYQIRCQVVNDDSHIDPIGRKLYRAGVTLRVYKDASVYDVLSQIPHFSVFWDEANSVARFFRNNTTKIAAGEPAYVGKAEISDLTSDLIEGKLLDFTNWLFQRSPETWRPHATPKTLVLQPRASLFPA